MGGGLLDRIGRYLSLVFMFLITAAAMFLMTKFAGSSSTLIPLVVFIGLCYGGYLGLFPSMCADAFGPKNLTLNYGLLFSAFSIAGALGPYVGAKFAKEPNTAFVIAGIICCFGLVLALLGTGSSRRPRSGLCRLILRTVTPVSSRPFVQTQDFATPNFG